MTSLARRLISARSLARRILSGPPALAFMPAAILAAFWLGGEGWLVVLTLSLPVAFAALGLFDAAQAAGIERGAHDFLEINPAVGAGDREAAVGKNNVGVGGLEHMRGDPLSLLDHLVGGEQDRRRPEPERPVEPEPRPDRREPPTAGIE